MMSGWGGGGVTTSGGGGRMVSGWGRLWYYNKWRRQDGVRVGEVVVLQPEEEAGWCQGGVGWGITSTGGGRMVSGWGRLGCYNQCRRQDGVRVREVGVIQQVEEAG